MSRRGGGEECFVEVRIPAFQDPGKDLRTNKPLSSSNLVLTAAETTEKSHSASVAKLESQRPGGEPKGLKQVWESGAGTAYTSAPLRSNSCQWPPHSRKLGGLRCAGCQKF